MKTFFRHAAWALAFVAAACGVTAGNPGSGGKREYLSVYGSVQTLERTGYESMRVGVWDTYGNEVTYTMSAANSTYAIDGLAPGDYTLQVGEGYWQPLYLKQDTLLNVIVPLPSAPSRLRFVALGPLDFCVLWSDNSGVESGFVLEGPHGVWPAPANATGMRIALAPDAGQGDYAAAARRWNAAFAGPYRLSAVNDYGASATASVTVQAYLEDAWTVLSPPEEPPQSHGNPEVELCLSVERNAENPQAIGP